MVTAINMVTAASRVSAIELCCIRRGSYVFGNRSLANAIRVGRMIKAGMVRHWIRVMVLAGMAMTINPPNTTAAKGRRGVSQPGAGELLDQLVCPDVDPHPQRPHRRGVVVGVNGAGDRGSPRVDRGTACLDVEVRTGRDEQRVARERAGIRAVSPRAVVPEVVADDARATDRTGAVGRAGMRP